MMKKATGLLVEATVHQDDNVGDPAYVTHPDNWLKEGVVLCARGIKEALGRKKDLPKVLKLRLWTAPGRGRVLVTMERTGYAYIHVRWDNSVQGHYGYTLDRIASTWVEEQSVQLVELLNTAGRKPVQLWLSAGKA
jgi:hypothetical protein